jgi:ATP-binding cassette, subfamily B, bacterial
MTSARRGASAGPVSVDGRLRRAGRTVAGTMTGLRSVVVMAWRAGPALTLCLAAATVLLGLMPAATAVVARWLVDTVAAAQAGGPTGSIVMIVAAQAGVLVANSLGGTLRNVAEHLLNERVTLEVQTAVMEHTGRLDLAFFENSESYDLLRQAQQEAATRPVSMISNGFGLVQTAVTATSMVGLLFGLGPLVALAALLAPIPAFLADGRYGGKSFKLAQWASPLRRRMQYLIGLVTSDTAAKEIKLFGLTRHLVDQFGTLGRELYGRQRGLVTRRYLSYTGWGAVSTGVGAVILLYVATQAAAGRMSVGDLVLVTVAVTATQGAVQTLLRGTVALYEDNLYFERLRVLLAVRSELETAHEPLPPPTSPSVQDDPPRPLTDGLSRPVHPGTSGGRLVLDGVSFRYPNAARPCLRDVSVEVPPGGSLAVVGRNGAGKSTLVKLICRLYDPTEGRVLLDGVDIREVDADEHRARIAAMFQDHVAYQATAAENIGLGRVAHRADRARITDAADAAGATDLLGRLPHGLDTQLGTWFDGGVQLSGGEWQKIALARAFMRDGPLLVLDEPTASLDAAAEEELFRRLGVLAAGRTTIYVSHRFSTVRRADHILLLADGRAAEYGTHAELLARGDAYAELFHTQALGYLDPRPASVVEPLRPQVAVRTARRSRR